MIRRIAVIMLTIWSLSAQALTPLRLDQSQTRMAVASQMAYFKDTSALMDLTAAREKFAEGKYTQETALVPNYGLTNSAYWFTFSLNRSEQLNQRWFVVLEYPNMDWFDTYFILTDGQVIEKHSGDRRNFATRDLRSINFAAEIPFSKSAESIQVFVRVQSSGSITVPLYVQELGSIWNQETSHQVFFGLVAGAMLIMSCYFFLVGCHARYQESVYLGLFYFTVAFYRMSYHGLTFEYIYPEFPDLANFAIPLMASCGLFLSGVYSGKFLDIARYPKLHVVYRLWVGSVGLIAVSSVVFEYKVISIVMVAGLISPVLWISLGLVAWRRGFKPAKLFTLAWTMPLLSLIIFNLMNLGWIRKNVFVDNAFDLSFIGLMAGLSFAASEKINDMNRATKRAQQQAIEAQVEARKKIELVNASLEEKVQLRTRELSKQTQEMKVILDNVQQGICTLDESMTIQPQHSKRLIQFIDAKTLAGLSLVKEFFSHCDLDSDAIERMKAAIQSMIGGDHLAFEINSHLLPRDTTANIRQRPFHLELDWAPIENDENTIVAALLTIKDVTELKKFEADAKAQKRELEIVGRIIHVPSVKMNLFLENSEQSIHHCKVRLSGEIQEDIWIDLLRSLHTIKGNARTYAFSDISSAIHESEDRLLQFHGSWQSIERRQLCLDVLQSIERMINEYRQINDEVLKRGEIALITKAFGSFSETFLAVMLDMNKGNRENLIEKFYKLNLLLAHSFSNVLSPLTVSLSSLSKQLHKQCPEVKIEGEDFDVRSQDIFKFEGIFMHMFRNSLDHGFLENFAGEIHISVKSIGDKTTIRYQDNGRGIPVERLRQKAIEAQIISADADRETIAKTLFHPGISSANKVTDISGRGIGMSAVKKFVDDLDGTIHVELLSPNDESGRSKFAFIIELPKQLSIRTLVELSDEKTLFAS